MGGVDNGAVELKYIVNGHEARVGVQAYAEEALVGLGGAAELVDEIVGAHGIIVSSIRGWGEGEGSGHDGCEWASPRFLAEPRNDRGYGGWGDHESRAYGGRGKALAMTDVNGQVLDSSRSLGMTGGMGRGGTMRVARTWGEGRLWP